MKVIANNGKPKPSNDNNQLSKTDVLSLEASLQKTYLKNLIKLFFLSCYEKEYQLLSTIVDNIDITGYTSLLVDIDTSSLKVLSTELYLEIRRNNITYISEKDIYDGINQKLHHI